MPVLAYKNTIGVPKYYILRLQEITGIITWNNNYVIYNNGVIIYRGAIKTDRQRERKKNYVRGERWPRVTKIMKIKTH